MRALLAVATVGIAVALALIVLLGVIDPQEQAFVWLENMRVGADIFQKVATAIALVIGGIFAWHRFIRGERDPRLQPTVAASKAHSAEIKARKAAHKANRGSGVKSK